MDLDFIHRFEPSPTGNAPTLLVLHGTGGDENDLIGVARSIAPNASLLSPRGKVLENGLPRFFRRFSEGVFDEDDLKLRARELASFVASASVHYGFDARTVIAFGYSNGANIAAATLLLHPPVLAGAILLRPMVPLVPPDLPDLHGKEILIESGFADPIGTVSEIKRLVELFGKTHAQITIKQHHGGHGLTQDDLTESQKWLATYFAATQ